METLDAADAVRLLRAMVGINSVNGTTTGTSDAEAALGGYLAAQASSLGFEVQSQAIPGHGKNVLVRYERSPAQPWLLFDSHIDTVPTDGMSVPPLGGEIGDGRLWGRGACDTKGSGAAMLAALSSYRSGDTQPNNVAILYSVDEEIGMSGIAGFIAGALPAFDSRVAGVVVGEPTSLRMIVAHNGVSRFVVRTKGIAAHASNPSRGKSAISSMTAVVTALEAGYLRGLSRFHALTGHAVGSINTIRGGSAFNVVADSCEIEVDRRLVPGERPEEVRAELQRALDTIRRDRPEVDFELESAYAAPALAPVEGTAFVAAIAGALRLHDLPAAGHGVPYATHAGLFAAQGLPAVVLGPGNPAQAHTADEWIDLEEFGRAISLYRKAMQSVGAA